MFLFLALCSFFILHGGVHDNELEGLARYRRSRTGRERGGNAARDFSRWVHRNNQAFPAKISSTLIPVTLKKRTKKGKKVHRCEVEHPVIHLSEWFRSIMANFPKFFLGGFTLDSFEKYEDMFATFWANFEGLQPTHPRRSVPLALHGDEGRGLAKVPLMVISFQVLIPFTGPDNLSHTQNLKSILFSFCF